MRVCLSSILFLFCLSLTGLSFAQTLAPGGPGNTPYWPKGDKQGVGTSMTRSSHVWFTVGDGTLNAGEKVVLTSDSGTFDEREIVDPSFLELVRMGVMRPDDPTILASLAVTEILGTQTPTGPGWHRYVHDGYGESADGVSYTGHGIGRIWPFPCRRTRRV